MEILRRGITANEKELIDHISRWGSDGYPIQKCKGGKWIWFEFFGVKGAPTVYKTKREAVAAFEDFHQILLDAYAGRI
jgi:hypothetical protein